MYVLRYVNVQFKIGREMIKMGNHTRAKWWLQRAHGVLCSSGIGKGMPYFSSVDLGHAIAQHLLRAIINADGSKGKEEAWNLLSTLREATDAATSSLLKLQIMDLDIGTGAKEYQEAVLSATTSCQFSMPILDTLLYYIRKLRTKSPEFSQVALETLLFDRLLPNNNQEWTEKVFLILFRDVSALASVDGGLGTLKRIMDQMQGQSFGNIGDNATRAIQMVMVASPFPDLV